MQCKLMPGQKVVCIHEVGWWVNVNIKNWGYTVPTVGSVYTIRELVMGGILCLRLVEIVNPPLPSPPCTAEDREPSFDVTAFKPLEEKKTDISALTKLLEPV